MEIAEKQGADVKALSSQPALMVGLGIYFDAYRDLITERSMGMSAGAIPWSAINHWAEIHGIRDIDDKSVLNSHVRAMEKASRDFEDAKGKKK